MSAADHLSQLEFPGMPPRVEAPEPAETPQGPDDSHYPEDGAHLAERWGQRPGSWVTTGQNPIYDIDAWGRSDEHLANEYAAGRTTSTNRQEFIPPWRVSSSQEYVNPAAIDHQVKHADSMNLRHDPDVSPFMDQGVEHYTVFEGNHRVNAAQRRGQLLMPANVERMV